MSIFGALLQTAFDVSAATADSFARGAVPVQAGKGAKKKAPCTPCAAKARAAAAMNAARGGRVGK